VSDRLVARSRLQPARPSAAARFSDCSVSAHACCSEQLRKFYEEEGSSKVVRLLTAINIFPCEVQNRYLEALRAAGGNSDSGAIIDRATATGKRCETICVKQMDRSQRLELRVIASGDGGLHVAYSVL
jgi:hypothetical protein